MILPLKLEFSVVAYVCQNPDGKYLSPCMELKRYITFDIGHMRSCDTLKRFTAGQRQQQSIQGNYVKINSEKTLHIVRQKFTVSSITAAVIYESTFAVKTIFMTFFLCKMAFQKNVKKILKVRYKKCINCLSAPFYCLKKLCTVLWHKFKLRVTYLSIKSFITYVY